MGKKKYGLDTSFWGNDFRKKFSSLEGFMGSAGFSGKAVASSPSELFQVVRYVYGVKTDMMAGFRERALDAISKIEAIPPKERSRLQGVSRAFIASNGIERFAKAATEGAGLVEMPVMPAPKSKLAKPRSSPRPPDNTKAIVRGRFYKSWEWRTLRMLVLKQHGPVCMCCGAERGDVNMSGEAVKICVDHIKPLSTHWHLRLDPSNLQVLCDECNQGKGAWDETDWRVDEALKSQLKYTI